MKSYGVFLATASLCFSGFALAQSTSNSSIYNGGDYAGAAQMSLQLITNLSQAIVDYSPQVDIFNTSDIIIAELKQLSGKLDILGAAGYAYAYQDQIPSLFNTDELVFTTQDHLSQIQDEYNSLINLYLTRKNKQNCANLYASEF